MLNEAFKKRVIHEIYKLNHLGGNGNDLTDEEDESIENIIFHLKQIVSLVDSEDYLSYEDFLSRVDEIKASMNENSPVEDCDYLKNICNELSNIAA